MDQRRRAFAACGGIVLIFLVVQLGALAIVEPFKSQNYQFVEDTSDPTNSFLYIGAILVATALMLAAIKLDADVLIRGFVVFSGAYVAFYVFQVVLPPVLLAGIPVVAIGTATVLGVSLWTYPEWYVIDAAGILMGIGAAGIFGINFGILPALVLLTVLAVYDAISVYGTEHMLTLASGVMEMRVPIVLVIPLSLSYSFLEAETPASMAEDEADAQEEDGTDEATANEQSTEDTADADGDSATETADDAKADGAETAEPDEEEAIAQRDALFIGLGDAVIPAILVASAGFFLRDVPTLSLPGLSIPLPAGTAMIGTLVGLVVLLWMVLKGRAHAGLPLLNGGAIAGYLLGAVASGITLVEALGLAGYL